MSDIDPKIKHWADQYKGFTDPEKRIAQHELLHSKNGHDPLDALEQETDPASWADLVGVLGPIAWDWQPWLPKGMLTILAGESGSGKSALALRICGCYLRGDEWPDRTTYGGERKAILWCEAEAAQAVNLERAKLWGLPIDRIYTPFDDPMVDIKLDEPTHAAALTLRAERSDIGLIVIDSLRGANSRDENSSETMSMVKWLAELARDSGKPILLTHHLRKRGVFDLDGVDLERLRGSSAIVQAARLVWALDTPDAQAKDWKRLQVVKSNLAKFPESIGMTIDNNGVRFGMAPEPPRTETVADKAADLLLALLQDEPLPARKIEDEFNQAGISIPTMKRAKEKLGIVSIKDKEGWKWSLPAKGNYEN